MRVGGGWRGDDGSSLRRRDVEKTDEQTSGRTEGGRETVNQPASQQQWGLSEIACVGESSLDAATVFEVRVIIAEKCGY